MYTELKQCFELEFFYRRCSRIEFENDWGQKCRKIENWNRFVKSGNNNCRKRLKDDENAGLKNYTSEVNCTPVVVWFAYVYPLIRCYFPRVPFEPIFFDTLMESLLRTCTTKFPAAHVLNISNIRWGGYR